MEMKAKTGVNVCCEGGKPLCRVHRVVFGENCKTRRWPNKESRYYCDGPAANLTKDHPLYGIGLVYVDEKDPITGWFKTAQEAVDEWKRLKWSRLKAKSVSEKKGVSKVGRTADNRRRV